MGIGESDNGEGAPQESFKEVRDAQQVLVGTMIHRLAEVHEQFKQGFPGKSWDEIMDRHPEVAPGNINFEAQWRRGSLVGEDEFQLESLSIHDVMLEPGYSSEEHVQSFEETPIEEKITNPVKSLRFKTRRHGKEERWVASFLPDSRPYAVNQADAKQVGFELEMESPAAARAIKAGFGEDAVPELSVRDMRTLAIAIQQTPAKVAGA